MKSLTFVVPIGIVNVGTLWYLLQPNESGVRFQETSFTVLSVESRVAFYDSSCKESTHTIKESFHYWIYNSYCILSENWTQTRWFGTCRQIRYSFVFLKSVLKLSVS